LFDGVGQGDRETDIHERERPIRDTHETQTRETHMKERESERDRQRKTDRDRERSCTQLSYTHSCIRLVNPWNSTPLTSVNRFELSHLRVTDIPVR
jgi:hypothetical protein